MAHLALNAVSAAIYGVLNVAGLTAICAGGVHDALPQDTSYPCLLFEVSENPRPSGLGTKPGQNLLVEVGIRIRVFSKHVGMKEAQTAMQKAIELLSVTDGLRSALTATGYRLAGGEPFYDQTIPAGDAVIAGETVRELVSDFRVYVEEA